MDGDGRVRLSLPSAGKTWRVARSTFEEVGELLKSGSSLSLLAERLLQVGILTVGSGDGAWTAARRFHAWSGIDQFRDGHDPSGAERSAVLSAYSAQRLAGLRHPPREAGDPATLEEPWASVVHAALTRVRANRKRLAEATTAPELLYSYGAAHSVLLLQRDDDGERVLLADPQEKGKATQVIRHWTKEPGTQSPPVVIIVAGNTSIYRDRYRHEKAFRGFLVDGGRVSAEVARALSASHIGYAMRHSDSSTAGLEFLGLEPFTHLLFASFVPEAMVPTSEDPQ